MRVLLILPGSLESNNGFHATEFAWRLEAVGVEVAVSSTGGHEEGRLPQSCAFVHHDELGVTEPFPGTAGPDLVHAWTPRERVRQLSATVLKRYPGAALAVHFEDDEPLLTTRSAGIPWDELSRLPRDRLDALVPGDRYHPVLGARFLASAEGFSWVIEELDRFNTRGLPALHLPPLADETLFHPRPINRQLRSSLGIPEDHVVISYCGNVHSANLGEVEVLYRAVAELNRAGCSATLLRSGSGWIPGTAPRERFAHVIELGWVERESVPEILAAADVLVQPGLPGPFNDSRVPCKLPEYFAMGRPVVLPRCNIGQGMRHGRDAFVVDRGDATSVVQAVLEICGQPTLRRRLEEGATAIYLERLCEPDLGERALTFYERVCSGAAGRDCRASFVKSSDTER